ncbi:MAG TPA: BlaI/MecI/CopY family transcriptional regulator [Phycisphaerae bacterium]|nr:BlaI/MecI/CopY family transcriptional regulator [Phycisphaerae bacterium]
MSRRQPETLSPAEWKVMRIVWQHGSCAARDVYEEAGRLHGWAVSTVKTMLRRLVAKGYLRTTRVGNSFLYRPARPALRPLLAAADDLLANAVEGTTGPLLVHMVKRSRLSAEDLAKLRALLDQGAGG